MSQPVQKHTISATLAGKRLDYAVRELFSLSWGQARKWIETGKISLDATVVRDIEMPVTAGAECVFHENAPRAEKRANPIPGWIVYEDKHVVVINKPSNISSVKFDSDDKEESLEQMLNRHYAVGARNSKLKKQSNVSVVHRIDRSTSGLIMFARSAVARESLKKQLFEHSTHRVYLALCHGAITSQTITSHILDDRGDGLRGSSENAHDGKVRRKQAGKKSTTCVEVLQELNNATYVSCKLTTGRTHQIRIHLSEAGHPLVGERMYLRNFKKPLIEANRHMLHAAELGFYHPVLKKQLTFKQDLPQDMATMLQKLSH